MKKNLETHEFELKYEIEPAKISYFESLILNAGAFFLANQLEHDFVPDVEDYLCRKGGLLLRFRQIQGKKNDILLTLKIKYSSTELQHYGELQYYFSEVNLDIFHAINDLLQKKIGITLPDSIHEQSSLEDLQVILKNLGFTKNRANIEKFRRVYEKGKSIFTIDTFPEGMGTFLELEAPTQKDLGVMAEALHLDPTNLEKKDYGEVIRLKKSHLTEAQKRVCLFTSKELERYKKSILGDLN